MTTLLFRWLRCCVPALFVLLAACGGGADAPIAASITTQPASVTRVVGQTADFSVGAGGSGPLSYQWRKNGADIAGANAASYTTPVIASADNGAQFSVVVSNSAGSVTSAVATLTAGPAVAPGIVSQPAATSVVEGAPAGFSVVATGSEPLAYEWRRDGIAIAGATQASYTTPATASADNGASYTVVVSNAGGSTTSDAAVLSVTAAPVAPAITAQPAPARVNEGQTATFSVSATGSAPLAYQWRKNGVDIAGATASSYTTPPALAGDDGAVFSVLVSNTYATPAASQGATLSITAAPIAPTITQHPASVSVNAGSAASFSVGAIGSAPLAYQWRRNGVDIAGATSASFQLASATAGDNAALFSVEVRNAAGAATSQAATLTVTGANPDIADLLRTRNCLACHDTDGKLLGPSWAEIASRYGGQTDSETYLVDRIRQGGRGVWGLIPMPPNPQVDEAEALTLARWFIAGAGIAITPPVITQHPISRSVQVGATASFSVIASGSAPMRYQWRRNGVDIAGATGPSYTTPATTIADNGARFSVVVGNPHTAQAISQEAVLSTSSTAGTYPDASITLVVPYAAGGATDVLARRLATALAKQFGQQVVVSNVGGAGGTLGAAAVAKAAADGYTLLLTDTSMATASALYRTLAFDPTTDFEYLGLIDEMPLAMLGKAGLPADNYAQLASWMQANAGNFVFANAGLGSPSDLCALAFQAATGVAGLNVPYKGSGPALTDLLGGQIDLFCDQVSSVASHVRAGQAKTYGVTSSQRVALAALSGVPTLAESGLAGFYVTRWHGLYAPRGTPRAVLDLVNAALARALADTDFVSSEQALGSFIVNDGRSAPAGHLSFVQSEIDKWGPLLKTRGQWSD